MTTQRAQLDGLLLTDHTIHVTSSQRATTYAYLCKLELPSTYSELVQLHKRKLREARSDGVKVRNQRKSLDAIDADSYNTAMRDYLDGWDSLLAWLGDNVNIKNSCIDNYDYEHWKQFYAMRNDVHSMTLHRTTLGRAFRLVSCLEDLTSYDCDTVSLPY